MAYLFNAVDDSGGDEGKQNIFGGQQTDQGVTSGGPGEAFQKSAAEGGGGAGGSGSGGGGTSGKAPSGGGGSKQQPAAYNPASVSSSYNLAAQSMKMPTQAFQRAESSLAKGSQQLQEQADAYTKKAQETAKGFGLGEETIQKAAAGEKGAYEQTAQRLREAYPGETFQAFGGLKDIPSVQNLRDPGALYREESGPSYSAGQSRFDAAMLRRNPAFVKQQQELLAKQKNLQAESQKRAEEETKKARELLKTEHEKATADIRGKIGDLSEGVISKAKERELAEEARRAALDPKAIAREKLAGLKGDLRQDLGFAPAGTPQARQAELVNYIGEDEDLINQLAGNVTINKDVDWRSMLGAEDVGQYNRLQGLLGSGDMLTQGGPLGEDYGFNLDDAYRVLGSRAEKMQQDEAYMQSPLGQAELQRALSQQGALPQMSGNIDLGNIDMRDVGIFGNYTPPAPPKPVKASGGTTGKTATKQR